MPKEWLVINQNGTEATIEIDGDIGEGWFGEGENTTKTVKAKLKEIANLKAKTITVNINSLGGSVAHGLGIHDALAQHDAEVVTNVNGLTASAATIIAQAGNVRRMSDNALYLIHQTILGVGWGNENELEMALEDAKKFNQTLLAIYAKRSGKDEKELKALMDENAGNGRWLDSDEALEYGLVDEVFEPMEKAAASKHLGSIEDFQKHRLPELPNNFKAMTEEEKNGVENTNEPDVANEVSSPEEAKALDNILKSVGDFFGLSKKTEEAEPEIEEPEAAAEVDTEDEKPEAEEPEAAAEEPEAEVIPEVEAEADEVAALKAELAEANAKLAELDAAGTKPDGLIGAEDTTQDSEKDGLAKDLSTLQGVWNGKIKV